MHGQKIVQKLMRGAKSIAVILMALAIILPTREAAAQSRERCFAQTKTCVKGRFLEYWEQNGGLAVFGYPITDQKGNAQYFERARFERHPENPAPYDVLLGRLSDERFRQQGLEWAELPRDDAPRADCLWFEQTRRNVCDQVNGIGFLTYWRTHGLQDPKLNAYGRSLALFGLPITSARPETNSSGEKVITQWFERARFEWHPGKPDQFKVLLGLMGREVYDDGYPTNDLMSRNVTRAFLLALSDGRYSAASQLYGGSYEQLRANNPDIAPGDKAELLRRACTQNGFQCMRPKGMRSVSSSSAEEHVNVSFVKEDGTTFQHPFNSETEFTFTTAYQNNRWVVVDLPPYLP
ncbi:MAG: hypothetical protein AVDCRST_MAG93-4225 [uncultured Chloroflexia bacterium]|uniref:Uncharacterized protein n=1 Tax=uncultured Chloroflexia bacterium TaxID=1672391 RepID=A0A6J4K4D5_9CHLR|nr:MAG: hypothetical protein AVDCRST_MAG93-4225 [uncultured Chloroflexia bacterium]